MFVFVDPTLHFFSTMLDQLVGKGSNNPNANQDIKSREDLTERSCWVKVAITNRRQSNNRKVVSIDPAPVFDKSIYHGADADHRQSGRY